MLLEVELGFICSIWRGRGRDDDWASADRDNLGCVSVVGEDGTSGSRDGEGGRRQHEEGRERQAGEDVGENTREQRARSRSGVLRDAE